jgi:adenosylmethionine-8-amino-7-oxononanoate aminotransferase
MCGFELVRNKQTKEPFDPSLKVSLKLQDEALKRGLVLFSCTGCVEGVAGDMLLVTPPLVITRVQVDELMDILKESLRAVQADVQR